jgi:hypothetical protein
LSGTPNQKNTGSKQEAEARFFDHDYSSSGFEPNSANPLAK